MKKTKISLLLLAFLMMIFANITYARQEKKQTLDEVLEEKPGIVILCYHDIGNFQSLTTTPYLLNKSNLEGHIQYFLKNGFTMVSFDDYIAINKGEKPMPKKAIMLSFDDGYESFYKDIFPLLKKYKVPAMMAIIGSWMENQPSGEKVKMSSWEQFREMQASGLVEIASHTYDLHKPVLLNEYGQANSAVAVRAYKGQGNYETQEAYIQRLTYDFQKAQAEFEKNMGRKARALVWPFGAHTDISIELAKQNGFEVTFILKDGNNPASMKSLDRARRMIIYNNVSPIKIDDFIKAQLKKDNIPFRLSVVNIDELYVPNNIEQTNSNIDSLVTRLAYSNTQRVILQAGKDTDGDGFVDKVYFYTKNAPVIVDIFSHVSGRLEAEGVKVYALLPALNNKLFVDSQKDDPSSVKEKILFDKKTQDKLIDTYRDLALYATISGVVFGDDLTLFPQEGMSLYAKEAYSKKFGMTLDDNLLKNADEKKRWQEWKIQSLIEFTDKITKAVRENKPEARTLRTIDVDVVLDSSNDYKYSQDYNKFIAKYDYVFIKEQKIDSDDIATLKIKLNKISEKTAENPKAGQSVIFGLPSYYHKENRWFGATEMRELTQIMYDNGINYFSFYPESLMFDGKWYFPNVSKLPF